MTDPAVTQEPQEDRRSARRGRGDDPVSLEGEGVSVGAQPDAEHAPDHDTDVLDSLDEDPTQEQGPENRSAKVAIGHLEQWRRENGTTVDGELVKADLSAGLLATLIQETTFYDQSNPDITGQRDTLEAFLEKEFGRSESGELDLPPGMKEVWETYESMIEATLKRSPMAMKFPDEILHTLPGALDFLADPRTIELMAQGIEPEAQLSLDFKEKALRQWDMIGPEVVERAIEFRKNLASGNGEDMAEAVVDLATTKGISLSDTLAALEIMGVSTDELKELILAIPGADTDYRTEDGYTAQHVIDAIDTVANGPRTQQTLATWEFNLQISGGLPEPAITIAPQVDLDREFTPLERQALTIAENLASTIQEGQPEMAADLISSLVQHKFKVNGEPLPNLNKDNIPLEEVINQMDLLGITPGQLSSFVATARDPLRLNKSVPLGHLLGEIHVAAGNERVTERPGNEAHEQRRGQGVEQNAATRGLELLDQQRTTTVDGQTVRQELSPAMLAVTIEGITMELQNPDIQAERATIERYLAQEFGRDREGALKLPDDLKAVWRVYERAVNIAVRDQPDIKSFSREVTTDLLAQLRAAGGTGGE